MSTESWFRFEMYEAPCTEFCTDRRAGRSQAFSPPVSPDFLELCDDRLPGALWSLGWSVRRPGLFIWGTHGSKEKGLFEGLPTYLLVFSFSFENTIQYHEFLWFNHFLDIMAKYCKEMSTEAQPEANCHTLFSKTMWFKVHWLPAMITESGRRPSVVHGER